MTRASRWIARHESLCSRKVFLTYNGVRSRKAEKFFEIFFPSTRKTSEERGSYLVVMTDRRYAVRRSNREKDQEEKFIEKIEKR